MTTKFRNLVVALFASVISVTLFACGPSEEKAKTITVVDMVGDSVEVPFQPTKVAVTSRAGADMLVAFGLGEFVDGVYKSVLDNDWALYLYPQATDYYAYEYEETFETFYARGVELVIAPEQYIAKDLREHGITAITVSQYYSPSFNEAVFTYADIIKEIWGDLAEEKVDTWKEMFSEVKSEIDSKIPKTTKTKSIYYVRGDKDRGLGYTDIGYSLLEAYADYLNLNYVGKQFTSAYPTAEEVIAINPDYMIFGGIYQNKLINDAKTIGPWNMIKAVTDNHLFNIPIGFVMFEQTSVATQVFLADLANKIYPELFNFDVEQMIIGVYETFFGKTLSSAEVNYMLQGLNQEGNALV